MVTPVILVFVIAVGASVAVIANERSESGRKEERQENLESFTEQVAALQQRVDPVVSPMLAAGAGTEPPETLKEDANGWATALEGALVAAGEIVPPAETESAHRLLTQAIDLYQSAARTFAVAADLSGNPQTKVLERAAEQVTQAGSIWQTAIVLVDAELGEADLGPSQIALPGTLPAPLPSTSSPTDTDKKNSQKKKDD